MNGGYVPRAEKGCEGLGECRQPPIANCCLLVAKQKNDPEVIGADSIPCRWQPLRTALQIMKPVPDELNVKKEEVSAILLSICHESPLKAVRSWILEQPLVVRPLRLASFCLWLSRQ